MNNSTVPEDRWLPWILGALALALYAPALSAGFMFDDRHLIVENPFLRDPRALWQSFIQPRTSTGLASDMYRPLTTATLMANFALGGLQPFGYHLVNLLLHWCNGVLVYRLLRMILPKAAWVAALVGAACFVAHPLHSNAVAYVASRSTLLATSGVLLAFWAYRQSRCDKPQRRGVWFASALAAFIAALGAKETPIVVPALVILLDVTVWQETPRRAWRRWLPFVLIGLAYLCGRRLLIGAVGPLETVRPGWFNLGAACTAVWTYLGMLVAPRGLCVTRVVEVPTHVGDPVALAAMAGYAALLITVVLWIRRRPLWAASLGWFVIALVPSHPIASLYLTAADHHLYLPSVGAMIALAAITDVGWRHRRRLTTVACTAVITACGVVTLQRSLLWRDEVRVWESTVREAPRMVMAWNNLGEAYQRHDRLEDAERAYLHALRLGSLESGSIIGNLGRVISMRGTHATALPLLQLAVTYRPRSPSLLTALGYALSQLGRYDEAEAQYRQAIAIDPAFVDAYQNWGVDLALQGQSTQAAAVFRDGLRWNRGRVELRRNLARALMLQDQLPEAAAEFLRIARSRDGTADDWLNAARLYEATQDQDTALAALETLVHRDPEHAVAHYRLGHLYGLLGRPDALRELQRAVTLAPSLAEAQYDLAVTYTALEPPQLDLAMYHIQHAQQLGYPVPAAFLQRVEALVATSRAQAPQ